MPRKAENRTRELSLASLVLLVAVAVRVVAFAQLVPGPAPYLRGWTQSDMHFFDRWARAIAAGDVLTRADMRPYHGRHRELACEALSRMGGTEASCDEEAVRRVWDGWIGRGTFWQDPLYPYLLATTYRVFGDGPLVGYGLNVLLGLTCVLLVFRIGALLGGDAAGTFAGLLAALYGPLVFYETLLLREVAISAAGLVLVLTCMPLLTRTDAYVYAGLAGAFAGVCVLLKATALPFVALMTAVIMLGWRGRLREARRSALLGICAFAVVMSPLVIRNLRVGVAPLQLASTGALNFLNGNAADRTSTGGSMVSSLAADILVRTDGNALQVVAETVRSHQQLSTWVLFVARKAVAFWGAAEVPNNASYAYFLLQVPWLAPWLAEFTWIVALAPFGLSRAWRSEAPLAPLLLYVAVGVATCALFYNLSRFRLPIACALLPLAGCALASGVELMRARRWTRVAIACGIAGLIGLLSSSLSDPGDSIRIADYGVSNRIAVHLARERAARGDVDGAMRIAHGQLSTEPEQLQRVEPGPIATRIGVSMSAIAGTFVELHRFVADQYEKRGESAVARYHRERAAILDRLNAPYRSSGL